MIGLIPTEYWEYSHIDVVRCLLSAFAPRTQTASIALKGLGACIPAQSGRVGIVLALRALNLKPGALIGVPLYSCPVVFKAITTAGFTPWFIDMDPATLCMSVDDFIAKSPKLQAVVALHMFGNLCDMPELLKAAGDKPIIEDCAQSIGGKINGRMAGSFGTISVFSFRSGKYLSVGEGGALFTNGEHIRSRLIQLTSSLPIPSRGEEMKHVAKTFIRTALRRKLLWGALGHYMWGRYNKTVKYTEKSPLVLQKPYRSDVLLATHRLGKLDRAIAAQRANAEYYAKNLELDTKMLCVEKPGTFLNRYLYPILFPSRLARDKMANFLFQRRIGTIKPYQDIVETATAYYGYSGGCPIAEDFSKRLLAIPVHHGLSKREVRRIAKCINEGWDEIKAKAETIKV